MMPRIYALPCCGRSSCEVENNFIYVKDLWNEAASRMSRLAGAIRSRDGLEEAAEKTIEAWKKLKNSVTVKDAGELWMVFRLRDGLICQYVYLQAMKDYMDHGGKSRGSALYTDIPEEKIDFSTFCGFICEEEKDPLIQEISLWKGQRRSAAGGLYAPFQRTTISSRTCGEDTGKTETYIREVW